MKTVVKFERVGRSGGAPIPDVELPGRANIGQILRAIEMVCYKRLRSASWEIGIDESLTEWDINFGRFGKGTVEYVDGP